ncbi:MAG: hypothetical protein AAF756_09765 [Pseudomonadota bacterium]
MPITVEASYAKTVAKAVAAGAREQFHSLTFETLQEARHQQIAAYLGSLRNKLATLQKQHPQLSGFAIESPDSSPDERRELSSEDALCKLESDLFDFIHGFATGRIEGELQKSRIWLNLTAMVDNDVRADRMVVLPGLAEFARFRLGLLARDSALLPWVNDSVARLVAVLNTNVCRALEAAHLLQSYYSLRYRRPFSDDAPFSGEPLPSRKLMVVNTSYQPIQDSAADHADGEHFLLQGRLIDEPPYAVWTPRPDIYAREHGRLKTHIPFKLQRDRLDDNAHLARRRLADSIERISAFSLTLALLEKYRDWLEQKCAFEP